MNRGYSPQQIIPSTMSKPTPKITAYLKTSCGWSQGVRAIMRKYGLEFEEKDIIANPAFQWEMEQRSGQSLSPCVMVDGHLLADVSGAEVEQWMIANGYLAASDAAPDAAIDRCCSSEHHKARHSAKAAAAGRIKILD